MTVLRESAVFFSVRSRAGVAAVCWSQGCSPAETQPAALAQIQFPLSPTSQLAVAQAFQPCALSVLQSHTLTHTHTLEKSIGFSAHSLAFSFFCFCFQAEMLDRTPLRPLDFGANTDSYFLFPRGCSLSPHVASSQAGLPTRLDEAIPTTLQRGDERGWYAGERSHADPCSSSIRRRHALPPR